MIPENPSKKRKLPIDGTPDKTPNKTGTLKSGQNSKENEFPKQANKKVKKTEDNIKPGPKSRDAIVLLASNKTSSEPKKAPPKVDQPPFEMEDTDEEIDESKLELPMWMQEKFIKDKQGRRPTDKGYDPTTIHVPSDEKLLAPPIIKQYLDAKSNHWDKLVAFKVWKFYYFYYNDALIVKRLCDVPLHIKQKRFYCFFHEAMLQKFAPILVEKGHKLVLVEQMEETVQKQTDLIRREVCQILTRGTYFENQALDYDSQFVLCIIKDKENPDFGIVFLDATTHEFHIGQFKDDKNYSNLRTLITRFKPVEIVTLNSNLPQECLNMFNSMPNKPTITTLSPAGYPKRIGDIFSTIKPYFHRKEAKQTKLPQYLEQIKLSFDAEAKSVNMDDDKVKRLEKKSPFYYAMQTLSLAVDYLKNIMLADTVFSMGNFLPYDLALEKQGTLYLDSQALENLEILDVNYAHNLSSSRSLFGYMDKTVTGFGRRLLKRWIASPTFDAEKIKERLDAVDDLIRNVDIADFFQEKLSKLPDIERTVSKIYNMSNKKRMSAVYFEDFAKNRLKDFMKFLVELKKVEEIIECFEDYIPNFTSKRLIQLTSFKEVDIESFKSKKSNKNKKKYEGIFPRINNIIEDLEKMVQIQNDLPIPAPGINKEIDGVMEKMDQVKKSLNNILEEQRKAFKCKDINFVHSKHRYELEIPEHLVSGSKRPKEFLLTSKRQGYVRFRTLEIEDLVLQLWVLECDFQRALVGFIVDYFRSFYERHAYWQQVVSCLAELDCLCSLAKLAREMETRCRPEVLPMGQEMIFDLKGMVHPCVARDNPNFVPNDVIFENPTEIFLITGPNMGGKSTLLRQTCLAIIMAQVGSYVPATHFRFTAIDRIFTRIGATDRLLEGKSTFFVEMEETYNIVNEATKNSFLIIDELGRGTSTYDGVAIAYATLKHLAEKTRCLTMFATHYHLLLQEFHMYKNISNYSMKSEYDEEHDTVKFLYKFEKGEALRSHGILVAKSAGLPESLITKAKEKAAFMTREKKHIGLEKDLMDKFNKVIDVLMECKNDNLDNVEYLFEQLKEI